MVTGNGLVQRHSDPSLSSSPRGIHFQNSRGHSLCEKSSGLFCWIALLRYVGTCLVLSRVACPGKAWKCVTCAAELQSRDHLTTTAPSQHMHHTSMIRDQTPAGLRRLPLSLGVGRLASGQDILLHPQPPFTEQGRRPCNVTGHYNQWSLPPLVYHWIRLALG